MLLQPIINNYHPVTESAVHFGFNKADLTRKMIALFLLLPLLRSWLPIIVVILTVVMIVLVPFSFAFSSVPRHGLRAPSLAACP